LLYRKKFQGKLRYNTGVSEDTNIPKNIHWVDWSSVFLLRPIYNVPQTSLLKLKQFLHFYQPFV